ncbi:MAG: type VI secretion system tip protein VgrG [Sandaracinaceae bacterium]|nr:type VI secretion system tip protein VgrG [Sandaracinaceae bacterium]
MSNVANNTLLFETTAEGFGEGDFLVRRMEGYEWISSPYEFHLTLQCNVEGGISPEQADLLLSSSARICFGPDGGRAAAGVLREIEQLEMSVDARTSLYRAVLVPRYWLTHLTRRTRAFNEKSIPEIFEAVLQEMGWASGTDYELRLNETYSPREYVVQFEETDFAFLSRWMERLGIYYYFEQGDEKEMLVICDANANHVAAPDNSDCFYNHHEQLEHTGGVHRLRRLNRVRAAKVHVRDYNWRTPSKPVVGTAEVDTEHGYGLHQHSGDHFKDDGEGAKYATLRAELWKAGKEIYTARTGNYDFWAGHRFTLSGSPVGELDQEYLITKVHHHAEQDSQSAGMGGYANEIEAIPFATQYRPPRVTPWPRIDGVITGKIDAESISSASPIDPDGRYRVVLPWDLYGAYGGKASRLIRKAEPYAGGTYGMHMTLHVGAEVLLAHIGGDPDRPIIVGSVPNPTMSTALNATNATRSAIRTRSGILIDFHDDAG